MVKREFTKTRINIYTVKDRVLFDKVVTHGQHEGPQINDKSGRIQSIHAWQGMYSFLLGAEYDVELMIRVKNDTVVHESDLVLSMLSLYTKRQYEKIYG